MKRFFLQFNLSSWIVVASLLSVEHIFADSKMPPIDDRCEHQKMMLSIDEHVLKNCYEELDSCIDKQVMQHGEPIEQAKEHCWHRPLRFDERFLGMCPEYMAEIETNGLAFEEAVLERMYLRNHFKRLNDNGYPIDVFKRDESVKSIRRILSVEAHHDMALDILRWLSIYSGDQVHKLDMFLTIHELDPDCPETLWMFPGSTYSFTYEIADNWLAGTGSGSELTEVEMRDLFLRIQQRLLEAYDLLIDQSKGERKLHWGIRSIHDSILSQGFENFQQLANLVDIGLENHQRDQRALLIRRFSDEFGPDSTHGRSHTLEVMCSSHAFELGLLEHCLKLLNHYIQEDLKTDRKPTTDWIRAAISLSKDLTRDCSDHPADWFNVPEWWNERRCLEHYRVDVMTQISQIADRFPEPSTSAEANVLKSYLNMDKTSDEYFLQGLALDDSMVRHAAPLSKRLHRLGLTETALNIVSNVNAKQIKLLDEHERRLFDKTANSIQTGEYKNWFESEIDFKGIVTYQ